MDPNKTLDEVRGLVFDILYLDHDQHDYLAAMEDLASKVEDLDEWLSRGGFLPDVWQRSRAR